MRIVSYIGNTSRKIGNFNSNSLDFPDGSSGKWSACNEGDTGDLGLILRSGRSPGKGNGNPLQYSGLGNAMDSRAWWAAVLGIEVSWTQLSN